MASVSGLFIYPIKSCRGISVVKWPVLERGFYADRRWMIVDAAGGFVTQRELPKLALVETALLTLVETAPGPDHLQLRAPGQPELTLPLTHDAGEARTVTVWRDQATASVHPLGSAWFSRYLGAPHELVYMPDSERRQVNLARARPGDLVSFADAYPFLLISEASLADLNARLAEPVSMARFRPNIVISGTAPFAEDGYARVRVGEISFRGPKRCERCVVTTVNPETGERGSEPLRALAKYRLSDQKVWFGMNLIHDNLGWLRVGDAVES